MRSRYRNWRKPIVAGVLVLAAPMSACSSIGTPLPDSAAKLPRAEENATQRAAVRDYKKDMADLSSEGRRHEADSVKKIQSER